MQSSFSVPITCVHRNISYQDWTSTTPHSFNEQKYLGAEGLIFFFLEHAGELRINRGINIL